MSQNKSIEEMDLEELQANITELPEEELLAYLNGTRNNRLKTIPKKTRTKKAKKTKTAAEDQMVEMLRAMGPDAMTALAKLMEGME